MKSDLDGPHDKSQQRVIKKNLRLKKLICLKEISEGK
jgi:hypothetical protein